MEADPLPLQLPSPLAGGCRVLLWVEGARELAGCRVPDYTGEVRSPRGTMARGQQWLAVCAERTGYPEAALASVPTLAVGAGEQCPVCGYRGLAVH